MWAAPWPVVVQQAVFRLVGVAARLNKVSSLIMLIRSHPVTELHGVIDDTEIFEKVRVLSGR